MAFVMIGDMDLVTGATYVIAQCLGAILGAALVWGSTASPDVMLVSGGGEEEGMAPPSVCDYVSQQPCRLTFSHHTILYCSILLYYILIYHISASFFARNELCFSLASFGLRVSCGSDWYFSFGLDCHHDSREYKEHCR